MRNEAKQKVLEKLITAMDDRQSEKMGAKPMVTIVIGHGEPPNPDPAHEATESPEIEAAEHKTGMELSDPRFEDLIKKKRG